MNERAKARGYHRPTLFAGYQFESIEGAEDPSVRRERAHATARQVVEAARRDDDAPARLHAFIDDHGIDALAELWADSPVDSLPGALWRLTLLRAVVVADPAGATRAFDVGAQRIGTGDPVVAGAPSPVTPAELRALVESLLAGTWNGDLGLVLDRAAAFARVLAAGTVAEANSRDDHDDEHATALTRRAARLAAIGQELGIAAKAERAGRLSVD